MCAKAVSSKCTSIFHVHVGVATNYSVVPWGGAALNPMQFSREELLTNIANYDQKLCSHVALKPVPKPASIELVWKP